jgi:hypothetical protein
MLDASRLAYKPGWRFKVGGPLNRFLCVFATTPDSNDTARSRTTQHMFEIPLFTSEQEAARWVFARLVDCERHEAGEFFSVDGFRPFFPHHEDEGDPYEHVERWETPC